MTTKRPAHASVLALLGLASAMAFAVGCASADRGTSEEGTTAQGLTSAVLLERSHIVVTATNVGAQWTDSGCRPVNADFRVTYENETLPSGTKITIHVGESSFNQTWIGDGFGFANDGEKVAWQMIRDLDMTASGSSYSAKTDAHAFGKSPPGGYDAPSWQYPLSSPEIQFVFRLELPDGQVLWDNRLHQDYWAMAAPVDPDDCQGNAHAKQVGSWGPF